MMIDEIANQLVKSLIPYINKLKLSLKKKKKKKILNFITVSFAICLLK